jgi:hypothetical protein
MLLSPRLIRLAVLKDAVPAKVADRSYDNTPTMLETLSLPPRAVSESLSLCAVPPVLVRRANTCWVQGFPTSLWREVSGYPSSLGEEMTDTDACDTVDVYGMTCAAAEYMDVYSQHPAESPFPKPSHRVVHPGSILAHTCYTRRSHQYGLLQGEHTRIDTTEFITSCEDRLMRIFSTNPDDSMDGDAKNAYQRLKQVND